MIQEAPLADLAPPRISASDVSNVGSEEEARAAAKVFKSQSFMKKSLKLFSGFPMEVYISPVVMGFAEGEYIGAGRHSITSPEDFEDAFDEEQLRDSEMIFEIFREWRDEKSSRGTLFIPVATHVETLQELTPWMILHAMFDSDNSDKLIDTPTMSEFSRKAHDAMSTVEGISAMKNVTLRDVEKIFTMGSAKKSYFSTMADASDLGFEICVQALTSGGFRYDRRVFANIASRIDKAVANQFQEELDELEELGPAFRQEFFQKIDGKVVIVNVTL